LIVVDASLVASWFFNDERDETALRAAERVFGEITLVPPIFPAELANALLSAWKKGRIPKRELDGAFERIVQLPFQVAPAGLELKDEVELAARYGLTVYDAMYLALAARHRAGLITRDARLRAAAFDAGLLEQET